MDQEPSRWAHLVAPHGGVSGRQVIGVRLCVTVYEGSSARACFRCSHVSVNFCVFLSHGFAAPAQLPCVVFDAGGPLVASAGLALAKVDRCGAMKSRCGLCLGLLYFLNGRKRMPSIEQHARGGHFALRFMRRRGKTASPKNSRLLAPSRGHREARQREDWGD